MSKAPFIQNGDSWQPPRVRIHGVERDSVLGAQIYDAIAPMVRAFYFAQTQAQSLSTNAVGKVHKLAAGVGMQLSTQFGQEILDIHITPELIERIKEKKPPLIPTSANASIEIRPRTWTPNYDTVPSDNPLRLEFYQTYPLSDTPEDYAGEAWYTPRTMAPDPQTTAPLELVMRFPGLTEDQLLQVKSQLEADGATQLPSDPSAFRLQDAPNWSAGAGVGSQPDGTTPWINLNQRVVINDYDTLHYAYQISVDFKHPLAPQVTRVEFYGGHTWFIGRYSETEIITPYVAYSSGPDEDPYWDTDHDHSSFLITAAADAVAPTTGLVFGQVLWSEEPYHRQWLLNVYRSYWPELEGVLDAESLARARAGGPQQLISEEFYAGTLITQMSGYISPLLVYTDLYKRRTQENYPLIGTLTLDKSGSVAWTPGDELTSEFTGNWNPPEVFSAHVV